MSNLESSASRSSVSGGEKVAEYLDGRLGIYKAKGLIRKVFPEHWSFMFGEMALYSFIILILTGIYLTLFFKPGMNEVVYHGSYLPMHNVHMSEAYESTLRISFDVRAWPDGPPDPPLGRPDHDRGHLLPSAAALLHRLVPPPP